jgi:hypothetical protein
VYALIVNGIIVRALIDLPTELVGTTVAAQEAAGYYAITGPARPLDDPVNGAFYEPSVSLAAGRPVIAWTQRPQMTDDKMRTVAAVNADIARDLATWVTDTRDTKAFLDDPDIQRVLDTPNNTAMTTSDLNRALKALVRQARRQANVGIRTSKVIVGERHPEALIAEI